MCFLPYLIEYRSQDVKSNHLGYDTSLHISFYKDVKIPGLFQLVSLLDIPTVFL